jgi:hypothetical protein
MSNLRGAIARFIARRWQALVNRMVQEVPEPLAICEFACRNPECLQGHWERCARRNGGPTVATLSWAPVTVVPATRVRVR